MEKQERKGILVSNEGGAMVFSYDVGIYKLDDEGLEDLNKRVFVLSKGMAVVEGDLMFMGVIRIVINECMISREDERRKKIIKDTAELLMAYREGA